MLNKDINNEDVKKFLIFLEFDHYQEYLKDESYDYESYFTRIYNLHFYEIFFTRNGFFMCISNVDDNENIIIGDVSESYSREGTINILNKKFKGVIRQNKIKKLLNDR